MYLINQDNNKAYNSADITNVYVGGNINNEIYITVKKDGGALEYEKVATFDNSMIATDMFLTIVNKIADFNTRVYIINTI